MSDLLDNSDDKYEDYDGTGAKDISCDGDGSGIGNVNGGGDRNTSAGGGSVEWIRSLIPSTQT